ncbi:thermonuclease family protein [Nannocystaceae bacterium ST9]
MKPSSMMTLLGLALLACSAEPGDDESGSECGPTQATVAHVVDGDTVDLDSGERVRYLLIDTPESTTQTECWGPEAKAANQMLVEGKSITLEYDVECEDDYGRLLAYVSLGEVDINRRLLEQGYACVLHIPPNGADRIDDYQSVEYAAEMLGKGLWAECDPNPCQ